MARRKLDQVDDLLEYLKFGLDDCQKSLNTSDSYICVQVIRNALFRVFGIKNSLEHERTWNRIGGRVRNRQRKHK